MFKLCVLLAAALVATACQRTDINESQTPDEVYRSYYEALRNGSLLETVKSDLIVGDELLAFKSKDQIRIDEEFATRARSNEEVMKAWVDAFRRSELTAQCGELLLDSEVIDGQKAALIYDRKEICIGDELIKGGVRVELVYEGGWKIDRISSTIPEHVPQ